MLNLLKKHISPNNPLRKLWYLSKAFFAVAIFGFPAKKLKVIGITGTNGKTTVAHMTEHILRLAGKKVGMLSSVEFRLNGKATTNKTKLTTLSPFATQKFFKKCVKNGIEYVVLEASSHALHQARLLGTPFACGVLTNITHEHLDYHKTMKAYKNTKKILIKKAKYATVLNAVDDSFEEFFEIKKPHIYSYGLNAGNLRASNVKYTKSGSEFNLSFEGNEVHVKLNILGSYNIENALAATGAALYAGCSLSQIKSALESFDGIPGRTEVFKSPKGFKVVVDFALTPDALQKLYATIQSMNPRRILGIIGSAGDHDKEKRPIIGEIVAKNCDICIITDDEPYTENPRKIMDEILKGAQRIKPIGKGLKIIEDRKTAIDYVIKNAEEGDVVVISGMGNLPNRMTNDGPVPWNERKLVQDSIKQNS